MRKLSFLALLVCLPGCSGSCARNEPGPVAVSGVHEVAPEVHVGADGKTAEQRNVLERLKRDNTPGAVKHLYVFSAYSGQCILYSTVREKVTSSGKRLSPTTVAGAWTSEVGTTDVRKGIPVKIGGRDCYTSEVLQDDGTYGSSIDYLYWFDARGSYHQHYLAGGQIVHVSDQPVAVKEIVINIEAAHDKKKD